LWGWVRVNRYINDLLFALLSLFLGVVVFGVELQHLSAISVKEGSTDRGTSGLVVLVRSVNCSAFEGTSEDVEML
jgi:hypothetical protein